MPRRTDQPPLPDRIQAEGRALLAEGGVGALTFDALARRLGVSKQAILYWRPSRAHLVSALVLPLLRAEVEAAEAALADAPPGAPAARAFLRAVTAHHLADLPGFRLLYLSHARGRAGKPQLPDEAMEVVVPVTSRLYDALEAKLAADPAWPAEPPPRRAAFALHAAALGVVLMESLAEANGQPHRHAAPDVAAALAALLPGTP